MNKSEAIDAQINRIAILTKRMERVTSFVKDKNDSAKSIQAALLIIQIVLQLANCKAQIMSIASQPTHGIWTFQDRNVDGIGYVSLTV